VHDVDLHATVDIGLGQDMRLQIGADVFNLIGSQQVTAVDQSWVFPSNTPVKAIPNGTIADLQHITSPSGAPYCTTTPCPASFPPGTTSVLNPNYGHATQYQAPRNFRLLARFTF
jgi:hypothetical protein